MESAACDVVVEAENRYKSSVIDPTLAVHLETRRWVLGPGRLKGQTGYDFIARGRGAMEGVQVIWGAAKGSTDAPNARRFKVMIGSEVLWRHHANGGNAYTAATETLEWAAGDLWSAVPDASAIAVRRLDVCVDHWGYTWKKFDLDRFACRQKGRGLSETREAPPEKVDTFQGPNSATYYVGARGSASRYLRIYDKVAEAQKSGKLPWMKPLWTQCGWDGKQTVWRAEVEFGGEWLKAHGFDSVEKLKGCEHAVWIDYLDDVRHTTGRATRLKRAATSAVWGVISEAVHHAAADSEHCYWIWKPKPPSAGGDMQQLTAMMAGCARKIRDAMFTNPQDRDHLIKFIHDAMAQSDEKAQARQARLVRLNPRSPPRPRQPQGAA